MKKILLQSLATLAILVFVLWFQKVYEEKENNRKAELSKKEIIAELKLNFMSFKSFHQNLSDYDMMLDSIARDGLLNRKKNIDIMHYKNLFRSIYLDVYLCKCNQFTFQNTAYTAVQKNGSLAYFDFDLIQDLEKIYTYQKDNCRTRDELRNMIRHQFELIEMHNYLNFLDLNMELSRIYLRGYHTYSIDYAFDDAFTGLGTSFEELGIERFLEKQISK